MRFWNSCRNGFLCILEASLRQYCFYIFFTFKVWGGGHNTVASPLHTPVEAAMIFFVHLSPLLLHWPHQTLQDVPVNLLVDGLALWQEFCVHNAPHIKESHQHHLGFGLGHPRFLLPRQCRTLQLKTLALGHWIVLKDAWLVASSKFGSVSSYSRMSWHTCTRCSFCSAFRNLGTIFAQICVIPRSFVMIVHTLSQFMSNSFAIILTVRWRRSPCTFWQRSSTFSSVLLVTGLPLLGSSSISSLPSLNLLCLSKARALDIASSPYTSCGILSASVGVFPSRTRNFTLVRRSMVIVLKRILRANIFHNAQRQTNYKQKPAKERTVNIESWKCCCTLIRG